TQAAEAGRKAANTRGNDGPAARLAGGDPESAGGNRGGRDGGVADQLEADGVVHREPVAHRPAAAQRRCRLGEMDPVAAPRGAGPVPACDPGPPISLVLVGRRAGHPFWTFRMHPELPRPVAGPAEVTPVVEFREASKWYGNVIGVNRLSLRIGPGVTGLLG